MRSALFYKAPWGKSVILVTVFSSGILLGLPILAVSLGFASGIGLFSVVVPLLIFAGTLPFAISGYELTSEKLLIYRLGWKSTFELASLHSAETNPHAMARSLRIFGNGGLFSVCGRFKNRELGSYRAFVTDPKNSVVLRFDELRVVVSPETPDEFVQELKRLRML